MKIYDDVMTPTVFNFVRNKIFDGNFPWFYSRTSYHLEDTSNFGFSHMVMADGKKLSPLSDVLETVIITCLDKVNEPIKELHRIRLGMLTRSSTLRTNDPHIDVDYAHKTGLIYLTTSDAPTRIYKEKFDKSLGMNSIEYVKKYLEGRVNIDIDIDSVENRMFCFDGMTYHSSTTPTDIDRRVVINFNYIPV